MTKRKKFWKCFYIWIVVTISISTGTVSSASLNSTGKQESKTLGNLKYHISTSVNAEKGRVSWSPKLKLHVLRRTRASEAEESHRAGRGRPMGSRGTVTAALETPKSHTPVVRKGRGLDTQTIFYIIFSKQTGHRTLGEVQSARILTNSQECPSAREESLHLPLGEEEALGEHDRPSGKRRPT